MAWGKGRKKHLYFFVIYLFSLPTVFLHSPLVTRHSPLVTRHLSLVTRGRPSLEEQCTQFLPPSSRPNSLDSEERDKRRGHDHRAGEYFMPALTDQIMKAARQALPPQKSAYHMFEDLRIQSPKCRIRSSYATSERSTVYLHAHKLH